MPRYVETVTWSRGDLFAFELRPFFGQAAEDVSSQGAFTKRTRIVDGARWTIGHGELDLEFLRVLSLAALVHAAFLVMVAATPKKIVYAEDQLHRYDVRAATLGSGDCLRRTVATTSIPGGSRKIVIPTPAGSRVRSGGSDAQVYAFLGVLGSMDGDVVALLGEPMTDGYGYGGLGISGELEGGVIGGVIGHGGGGTAIGIGSIGTIGLGSGRGRFARSRCDVLIDHMLDRVITTQRVEAIRSALVDVCRSSSSEAVDCIEQVMSEDQVSSLRVLEKCGPLVPPRLAEELQIAASR